METITYTNSQGESVTFGGPPFYLQSITGLGDVSANIQRIRNAYVDGSQYVDTIMDDREIPISFVIAVNHDESYGKVSEQRSHIGRVLNPKLGLGTLRYENESVVREIKCIADSIPAYPDNGKRSNRIQVGTVTFIAPEVYWQSLQQQEEPMFEGAFMFPFEGEFIMGMQRDKRNILNDGDAPSDVIIEFYGPAINPAITNETTNQMIKVNRELLEGERMVIDTKAASVVFVDVNGVTTDVSQWLMLDSALSTFKLVIGDNSIVYSADNDISYQTINLLWRRQYAAI